MLALRKRPSRKKISPSDETRPGRAPITRAAQGYSSDRSKMLAHRQLIAQRNPDRGNGDECGVPTRASRSNARGSCGGFARPDLNLRTHIAMCVLQSLSSQSLKPARLLLGRGPISLPLVPLARWSTRLRQLSLREQSPSKLAS